MFQNKPKGPKVLRVEGQMIRNQIAKHAQDGVVAGDGYRRAMAEGLGPKVPWARYIRSNLRELEVLAHLSEVVASGPHEMSVEQFKGLWDHFADWYTAEDLIREYDKKKAGEGLLQGD